MKLPVRPSGSRLRRQGAAFARLFGLAAFVLAPPLLAQPKPQAGNRPAATSPPAAASPEVMATVLAIDDEDLVVDLGTAQGAYEGATVEIWRPFKLRHPVSGKVLEDRFRIGALELGQVRAAMSLARPSGALTRTPEKGDVVIFQRSGSPSPSSSTAPSTTTSTSPETQEAGADSGSPSATSLDTEAEKVSEMFESLRGADLTSRVRRYEGFAQAFPKSRFTVVLLEEAAALRHLIEVTTHPPRGGASAAKEETEPTLLRFEGPQEIVAEQPLELVVQLSELATGALLHVRRAGEPAFLTTPMIQTGKGYWSARVAQDKIEPPELEYFIEATNAKGAAIPVVASSRAPNQIEVLPVPKIGPPSKVRASAMLLTDYADYNGLKGNDYVWQTEGTFGLRYQDTGMRALRTGFGVFRGVGGSLRELDELGLKGRPVGLTYGYLEGEVGVHRYFSLIGRAAVGLQDNGLAGGGQILFRIGNDLETNLLLGGELLGGIGLRGITQLELNTVKRVPILIRTEITNQPAGSAQFRDDSTASGKGEVGVRTIVQVGYRFTRELVVSARVSFQGRTINHGGPGVGGAVGYAW